MPPVTERRACVEILERDARIEQIADPSGDVVAVHVRNCEIDFELVQHCARGPCKTGRVEATCIDHDLDAPSSDVGGNRPQLLQEAGRVARIGVLQPGPGEDEHCHLGEVVAGDHVDRTA